MIVSVTPNTAIDYTMLVPEVKLGSTIRATESAWGMGGKAADASWILGQWGEKNLALGFAAGINGLRMDAMLQQRGCQTDFVWVYGETRVNFVVCVGGQHTTFTSSPMEVAVGHIDAFFNKYSSALHTASCVIVGGSLPGNIPQFFYHDVIQLARKKDIPVVFDSSGPGFLTGLKAKPTIIKPNWGELIELVNDPIPILDPCDTHPLEKQDIYTLAKQVQEKYGINIVATIGKEGAIALIDSTHYWIPSLGVNVVSAAGAGDAVSAGLAIAYSHHKPIEEGLRLGFALANAVLLSLGTADYNVTDAKKFIDQIQLIPLNTN